MFHCQQAAEEAIKGFLTLHPELLIAAGFEQRLSGDHIPRISEHALGDEESGSSPRSRAVR